MSVLTVLKLFAILGTIAGALFLFRLLTAKPEDPPKMKDGWWGRGPMQPDTDLSINSFKIQVPRKDLTTLQSKLNSTHFGEDLEDTAYEYGVKANHLKDIVQYWSTQYDWKREEKEINKFPHFKTRIEGIGIHFIRVVPVTKTEGTKPKPLLMLHGWPGSVWEFYKAIPLLTEPVKHGGSTEDAFEVICPSIPGYGWSEAPHQPGFDSTDAARVFFKLMKRLGHEEFYIQGGDWGSVITTYIASAYPENVRGIHINMVPLDPAHPGLMLQQIFGVFFPTMVYKEHEIKSWYPISNAFKFLLQESGYMHIQATKPDTVAAALLDSPAGLAAYILEKFSTWTDANFRTLQDGGLTKKFTLDELLTNVMIYYTTNSIGSSMRLYKEHFVSAEVPLWDAVPVTVPAGIALCPKDIVVTPEAFARYRYKNLIQFTDMPRCGHFVAMEEPQLFANDVKSFVRKVERHREVESKQKPSKKEL